MALNARWKNTSNNTRAQTSKLPYELCFYVNRQWLVFRLSLSIVIGQWLVGFTALSWKPLYDTFRLITCLLLFSSKRLLDSKGEKKCIAENNSQEMTAVKLSSVGTSNVAVEIET